MLMKTKTKTNEGVIELKLASCKTGEDYTADVLGAYYDDRLSWDDEQGVWIADDAEVIEEYVDEAYRIDVSENAGVWYDSTDEEV